MVRSTGHARPIQALATIASSLIVLTAVASQAGDPNPLGDPALRVDSVRIDSAQPPGAVEVEHFRRLHDRIASEDPSERIAAIRELGQARPRSKKVVQLLRQIAWHSDRTDEREAAKIALSEIGVECGEPPAEERSWVANLGTRSLMLAARSLLESFETEREIQDPEESLDRRKDRERERAEIAAK